MAFVDALKVEFARDIYVAKVSQNNATEGIFVMNLSCNPPSINLCLQTIEGRGSLWRYLLQDEDIQFHMEEVVGIYDPEGLLAYAAYFRDALVEGATIDYIPKVDSSLTGKLDLVLQYKIGTLILEGRIQFVLVQEDINGSAYEMMISAYAFDSSCKIATGTRNTSIIRKTKQSTTSKTGINTIHTSNDGIITNSNDENEEINETTDGTTSTTAQISTSSANTAAMKAKKRRIGGVNIFPGMKKK